MYIYIYIYKYMYLPSTETYPVRNLVGAVKPTRKTIDSSQGPPSPSHVFFSQWSPRFIPLPMCSIVLVYLPTFTPIMTQFCRKVYYTWSIWLMVFKIKKVRARNCHRTLMNMTTICGSHLKKYLGPQSLKFLSIGNLP